VAELVAYPRIHIIGASGAGMSGIAKLACQQGHPVTGSDLKPNHYLDALTDLGAEIWVGHRPERVDEWDLVVVSSAVPERDPEVVAAQAAGVPVWERPRFLEALTMDLPAVGFTGTHGKTTSTALAVAAARGAGRDPTFLLGGELIDLNTNAHRGEDDLFLLESDEAFGTFRSLVHRGLLVTSVEADHLDHYESVGALEDAFVEVAAATNGPVVVSADDPGARRLGMKTGAVTYGTRPDADWRIEQLDHGPWQSRFTLRNNGVAIDVQVPRPGLHVIRNAAGVLALLAAVGIDPAAAAVGLKDFSGIRRRFEVRGRVGEVTIVDDYAHHPTEIAATIAAARLGSAQRLWAVFQPHRYSRTAELAAEFGPALAAADRVVVTDIYGAGEAPVPGISGRLVAEAAVAAGASVEYVPLRRDLAAHLAGAVAPGDLVILLGAGDITAVAGELVERLGGRP
jgi:UDP-N-acetylmuramate--alanine ligase